MTRMEVSRAIAPLRDFVRDYNSVALSLVFGGGALVISLVLPFGPPWPTVTRAAAFAAIVTTFAMAVSFTVSRTFTRPKLRTAFILIVITLGLFLVAYASLHSCFVYDAGNHDVVGGFLLHPNIPQVLELNPEKSFGELLSGAEWEPTKVWRHWTVSLVQLGLLLSWLGICGATSAAISAFVVLQYKTKHPELEKDWNMPDISSKELLNEKLEFLRKEEVIASDAAQRFTLKKRIEQIEEKLQDLGE